MHKRSRLSRIELRPGMHLWSNPSLRGTPAEIPVILARPTLYDVVELARRYPLAVLHQTNRRLRAVREISERQYLRTQEILRRTQRVMSTQALSITEVAEAVTDVYEDPPPPCEEPTPEQRRRSLTHWLPNGLRTLAHGDTRCIDLAEVPYEFEVILRRWLRWQLDTDATRAADWILETGHRLVLSQAGWTAFMAWLTDAMHHRMDQIEVGM